MLKTRDTAVKALKEFFEGRQEITLVYLFVSYLKKASGGFHDIDIAVYVEPASLSLDRELRCLVDAGFKFTAMQKDIKTVIDGANFLEKIGIVENADDLLNIRELQPDRP